MKFTRFAVSAAAALAFASGAFAATSAGTPIVLQMVGPGQYAGSFSGSGGTNIFDLDLNSIGTSQVTALLTANSILGQGYDISSATFNSIPFAPVVNVTTLAGSVDYWTYGPALASAGFHTLVVSGMSDGFGGGFTGSISVTAEAIQPPQIPEPGSYAMMLAGLGVVGFIAARRRQRG